MARKNNQLDHDGVLCNWCSSKLDLESLQSRCSLYLAGLWSSPDVPRQCLGISMFSVQRWATAGVLAKEDPLPLKQKRGKWLCANQREHYILGCKWKLLRCVGYHKKDIWIIFFFFFFWMRLYSKQNTQWLADLSFCLISLLKNGLWPDSIPPLPPRSSFPSGWDPHGNDFSFANNKEDDWATLLLVAPLLKVHLWGRHKISATKEDAVPLRVIGLWAKYIFGKGISL